MTVGLRKALKMSGFSVLRDGESDFSFRDQHEQKPIVMKTPGILSKSEWSYALVDSRCVHGSCRNSG